MKESFDGVNTDDPWVVSHRGPGVQRAPPSRVHLVFDTISSLDAFPSLYGQELTPGVVINTLL